MLHPPRALSRRCHPNYHLFYQLVVMTDLPLPEDNAAFSSPARQALRELRARAERRRLVTQAPSPETPAAMQQLVQELQVHQIELEMQYEELLVAQAEAEASRVQYQDLYEFAPVGYCTLAPDGTLRQLNLRMAQLLGTVRQQLQGRRLALFVAPGNAGPTSPSYLLHLLHTAPRHTITLAMQRPDGQPLDLRLEGTRAVGPDGQPQLRLASAGRNGTATGHPRPGPERTALPHPVRTQPGCHAAAARQPLRGLQRGRPAPAQPPGQGRNPGPARGRFLS